MNLYGIIALIFLIVFFGTYFKLGPAIQQIANGIASIFQFADKGANPALFDLTVFMCLLIALVGLVKVIVQGNKEDD